MIKRMKGEEKQSDRREMKSKNNRRKKKRKFREFRNSIAASALHWFL
jgi:hypothetical protein